MNTGTYFPCLEKLGELETTSSVLGFYSLETGLSSQPIIPNAVNPNTYTTYPTINAEALPILVFGTEEPYGGAFDGNIFWKIFGIQDDFSILLEYKMDKCLGWPDAEKESYCLLSSYPDAGFSFELTNGYRLVFNNGIHRFGLGGEVPSTGVFYFSCINGSEYEMGFFDTSNGEVAVKNFSLPYLNERSGICVGSGLAGIPVLSGMTITNCSIFNSSLSKPLLDGCALCHYVTGIFLSDNTGVMNVPTVTGVRFGNELYSGVSGTTSVLVSDGGYTLEYNVDLSGLISGKGEAYLLTGTSSVTYSGEPTTNLLYDSQELQEITSKNISLDGALESGDYIEIYSYASGNDNVNLELDGWEWPGSQAQIIANGLLETYNVDYFVANDNSLSGFLDSDVMLYDIQTGTRIVSPFSGAWASGRIQLSGGAYFPSSSQFYESGEWILLVDAAGTGTNGTGILSSGLNDLYLNGQKLIKDSDFIDVVTGDITVQAIHVSAPTFSAEPVFDPVYLTLPTGVTDISDNELTILPRPDASVSRYMVTETTDFITGVSGFSNQLWINGLRQKEGIEFRVSSLCSIVTGFTHFNDLTTLTCNSNHFNLG